MASNSPVIFPIVNRKLFEDMLAEEVTFTPSHQPRHEKFTDTVQRGLTSIPHNLWKEFTLPFGPTFQSHQEETGLHTAAQKFQKMQEPKFSTLKGVYTASAGLVVQSWLKDIYVYVRIDD